MLYITKSHNAFKLLVNNNIMTITLKRKPFYTTPDKAISFVPNDNDGPHAYDVIIKNESHLYIPDRTLQDLTAPEADTKRVMGMLEAMCGGTAEIILKEHDLTPKDFHIALLQLRVREQEREMETAYSNMRIR